MIDILAPANISDCGRYRYSLHRSLGMYGRPVCFIMLNPSTADAVEDDPTIRRCKAFAAASGGKDLIIVNLFALRSSKPDALAQVALPDAIGPENDAAIDRAALYCIRNGGLVVAAWGAHGVYHNRGRDVRDRLLGLGCQLFALRLTGLGQPAHPLYLPKTLKPFAWVVP